MPTELTPIEFLEGVEPETDRSSTTTRHYIATKGVRFQGGFPEKIGGNSAIDFDDGNEITGIPRSIFSYKLDGYARFLIGTNTRLYDLFGTELTNVTPLSTTTTTIANSLDTYYGTLANNPITTVNGSTTITIADTAHRFVAGDSVTLSGSSAVNGIPDTDINADHYIRSVATNSFTIIVNTAASSSGTGGGASVVRTSGIVKVNAATHAMSNGDRVKIASAATFGGITDTEMNKEFIIRNVSTNAFDVVTADTATSSVTSGGGASTTYQKQIAAGNADTALGSGYGLGLYGVGLYGVSKMSSNAFPPRIWSHDRFGDLTISMHNSQGELYLWDGARSVAPAIVSGAPQGEYCFVSDNIAVVLGAEGIENRIQWSDQGGLTNWTTGQAGEDDIEGAGRWLSHASARGENLLFTETQVYRFRYIGGQFIWQTTLLDPNIGIISQNARVVASGVVYWMDKTNFYMWRGGNIEIVPSNSTPHCTCIRYILDDLNYGQREKIFAFFNPTFREIQWHYPSAEADNPDRIVRLNIDTFSWTIDEKERTAAEYPSIVSQTPLMADADGVVYIHETGVNDNGAALDWYIESAYAFTGTKNGLLEAVIPDNVMTGSLTLTVNTKSYPQSSANIVSNTYTVSPDTERVVCGVAGRYWNFKLSSNALDQEWCSGQWLQEIKESSPK